MNKGFTLVELSIVLVIIGLLTGGILVAQSLISSAKINQVVRQFQQYDIAVNNFKERFRKLPGDNDLFAPNTGNGNGIIEDENGALDGFHGEIASFWTHLQSTGLNLPGSTLIFEESPTPIIPGTHIPEIDIDTEAGLLVYGVAATRQNYYFIGDTSEVEQADDGFEDVNLALFGVSALAIDRKIDDGVANTGQVVGMDSEVNNTDSGSNNCRVVGSSYNLDATREICNLRIDMLSLTN